MTSGSASLQPTYHGHVSTTLDALILFEACLTGQLHHVPRRPHDRERSNLICSGCVFIYEENASGIKRWTDGVPWSPSRILGNFLLYRELEKPFPPGEKKRATKRSKRPSRPGEPYPRPQSDDLRSPPTGASPTSPSSSTFKGAEGVDKETERSLVGSLVDSYGFKDDGLVKKTISVNVNGIHHHLVSYYKVEDVLGGGLETPSQSETLRYIKPRHDLTSRQNFRAPLDEVEEGFDPAMDGSRQPYGYGDRGAYDRRGMMPGQGYRPQQAPPGYGFSGVEGLPYPDGAQPHPGAGPYGSLPAPPSATPHPYYPQAAGGVPHGQAKSEEFQGYTGPYASRFEPIPGNIGGVPPGAGERGPQQLQPMGYPPQQIRTRPGGAEVPNMVDTKSPTGEAYNRQYYASPRSGGGQSPYPAPSETQRWEPPSSTPRSESIPAYQGEKAYWPVGGSVGQAPYPNPSAMQPHWNQHPSM
ncbi:MAG: hypothetical protein M4579_000443 [Chaenotheca gracillima]|nr:MAG: hypothetical protein M4579_000443 [Chaenotheca gracillima]